MCITISTNNMIKRDTTKEFIEGALAHGTGMREKNPEKANLGYARLNSAYKLLKKNDPQLSALIPLLRHEDVSVRSTAAAHLLPIKPDIALPVLIEISKSKEKPFGFSAMMVIKQWKKGQLSFEDSKNSKE